MELAPAGDLGLLVALTEKLLADPVRHRAWPNTNCAGYANNFSMEHTIRTLQRVTGKVERA